jgi:hypothetical protein
MQKQIGELQVEFPKEKLYLLDKAAERIDYLMRQRDEDSKKIKELEGLISKVLPLRKKMDNIKEKMDGIKGILKETAKK